MSEHPKREMKRPRKKAFKLRLDLLEHVTPEDIVAEAMANVSRYKPEPSLAKTGVGYLRPALGYRLSLIGHSAKPLRSEAFIKRLKARAAGAKRAKGKKKA